jgi:hypothetical protein
MGIYPANKTLTLLIPDKLLVCDKQTAYGFEVKTEKGEKGVEQHLLKAAFPLENPEEFENTVPLLFGTAQGLPGYVLIEKDAIPIFFEDVVVEKFPEEPQMIYGTLFLFDPQVAVSRKTIFVAPYLINDSIAVCGFKAPDKEGMRLEDSSLKKVVLKAGQFIFLKIRDEDNPEETKHLIALGIS